jgi:hypothetical protein
MCGTWISVHSSLWLSKVSPQGQCIRELGNCDGSFSPRAHIACFLAVQSRSCRYACKSALVRLAKNTFDAVSKAERASSNVSAVPPVHSPGDSPRIPDSPAGFLESGRGILRQSEALSSSQPVFCWLTVHRHRPRIFIRQARSDWRDFVGFADGELERSCAPAISIAQ